MIIRKYISSTLGDALLKAKMELGDDIIIISQRTIKTGGFLGLFKSKNVEITVTKSSKDKGDSPNALPKKNIDRNDSTEEEFKKSIESIKKIMQNDKMNDSESRKVSKVSNTKPSKNDDNLRKDIDEIKNLVNTVIKNTSVTADEKTAVREDNKELITLFKKYDIDETFFDDLVNEIKSTKKDQSYSELFRDILERDILITQKDLKGKVVLVGPTGVGKTTTIAKLAGRLSLVEKKKIGLITVDTYRIGAIEQLKTYAEIMDIPFAVVITANQMEEAIEKMKDCDVILIDTTGRSSKNTMQISELRTFIQKANPDMINMVVSATTKNRDLKTILEGYSELNYNSVIITKLDETICYGCLYNISRISNKPISFLTVGQNVPDDIKMPSKEIIAELILGEETVC